MAKSKIIKELANGTIDTQTALKRTKVLLQDLDNDEILKWVNYEIGGYPSGEDVPEYRQLSGQLYGSYFKGSIATHMKYNNVSLPLGNMPEDVQQVLLTCYITQGVEALKGLIEEHKQGDKHLCKNIPADNYPYIAHCNNDLGMIITSARVEFSIPDLLNIFPKVENKLLDILSYLEKQFGNLDDLDIDIESKNKGELQEIVDHIHVLIYNDHRVTIGDGNEITDSTIASIVSQ